MIYEVLRIFRIVVPNKLNALFSLLNPRNGSFALRKNIHPGLPIIQNSCRRKTVYFLTIYLKTFVILFVIFAFNF